MKLEREPFLSALSLLCDLCSGTRLRYRCRTLVFGESIVSYLSPSLPLLPLPISVRIRIPPLFITDHVSPPWRIFLPIILLTASAMQSDAKPLVQVVEWAILVICAGRVETFIALGALVEVQTFPICQHSTYYIVPNKGDQRRL